MRTIDAARNKWEEILTRLGIESRYLQNKNGPCPVCGGTDRFRFDNKNGNGTWYCNQCDPHSGNGINLLMNFNGWEFAKAASEVDQIVGNCKQDESKPQQKQDPKIRLRKIQDGLQPIDGINPVSIYLKNRGLPKSSALRYHPKQAYYEDGAYKGSFPCMVAVFSGKSGKPLTFHLTHITKHGTKAEVKCCKKVLPPVNRLQGGAIRLFDSAKVMGIAEGIETALACYKLFNIPTWAAYSANILESFEPPEECEHLVIFGDNDTSYTGHKAAYVLANKLAIKGVSVEVRMASNPGNDWADELKQEATQ